MAIVKVFNDAVLKTINGSYPAGSTWELVFLSDTYASIDTDAADPVLGDYTVASGGNVSANYTLASAVFNRASTVAKFDAADIGTITKNASNPDDVRCAMLINATASNEAIQVWDLTTDGTTALDLVNNDLAFTFGAGGINTTTNASA